MGDYNTNSLDLKLNGNEASLEDLTWADSCFNNNGELSDEFSGGDWSHLADALVKILSNTQTESANSILARRDGSPEEKVGMEMEVSTSIENVNSYSMDGTPPDDSFLFFGEEVKKSGDNPSNENTANLMNGSMDTFWSRFKLEDVLLPTYNEKLRKAENSDSAEDLGIPTFPPDSLTTDDDDIFKVWDLDIAGEENELIKQLNKALTDHALDSVPSNVGRPRVFEDCEDASIDYLISGIADLSFKEKDG